MNVKEKKVPRHVGIIMDGNGRWAGSRGLDRLYGHSKGVDSVREVVKAAIQAGVGYLTVYAFSKENWGRPKEEVDGLMDLFCHAIREEIPELINQGVRLRFIGERASLSPEIREAIENSEKSTADGQTLTLIVAINYSSRAELTNAFVQLAKAVESAELLPENITEQLISDSLYTKDIPDPDLIIRTSNELRISNFLSWQIAYSELYFTEVLWPDFDRNEFFKALDNYSDRNRRFGLIE